MVGIRLVCLCLLLAAAAVGAALPPIRPIPIVVGDALAGLQARCEEIIARGDELADGCTDLLSLVGSVRAQIAEIVERNF